MKSEEKQKGVFAMMREDRIRLLDIADSIREIQAYLGKINYEIFSREDYIREAISSYMLQIGGAAALLSDEFKDTYGEIDWDMLRGFQYANFDQTLELDGHSLWHIIREDLPEIMNQILDLADVAEDEEDLKSVTLNDEDLNDVRDIHFNKELIVSVDENMDIRTEDETEPRNLARDLIIEEIPEEKEEL